MSVSKTKFLALGLSGLLAIGIVGGASATFNDTGDGGPRAEFAHRRPHFRPVVASIKSIMETCDLAREELKAGYQAGQSINEILEAKGSDPAQCKADVLAKLDARLQEAVDNGKITEERKAEMLAKAEEGLARLMAREPRHRPAAAE